MEKRIYYNLIFTPNSGQGEIVATCNDMSVATERMDTFRKYNPDLHYQLSGYEFPITLPGGLTARYKIICHGKEKSFTAVTYEEDVLSYLSNKLYDTDLKFNANVGTTFAKEEDESKLILFTDKGKIYFQFEADRVAVRKALDKN